MTDDMGEETTSSLLRSLAKKIKHIDGNMITSSKQLRKAVRFGGPVVTRSPGRKVHFYEHVADVGAHSENNDSSNGDPVVHQPIHGTNSAPVEQANVTISEEHVEPVSHATSFPNDVDSSNVTAANPEPNVVLPSDASKVALGNSKSTFAQVLNPESSKPKVIVCQLESDITCDGADIAIPRATVEKVSNKFKNTLYGYFIGKNIAFPVVEYYVRSMWSKYGLTKVMRNAKGFFFFQFEARKGMEEVLENGPWIIRNVPIFLKECTLNTCLLKEDLTKIPVWIKLHDVPFAAYSAEGLSMIATKLGIPKMLDSMTSKMCEEAWGRCSFARVLIEVSSENDLKDSLIVAIPLMEEEGFSKVTIRVEYEWKPPRCHSCRIFGHDIDQCPKRPREAASTQLADDGFVEVTRKQGKGKQPEKGRHIDGVRLNKPKPSYYYRPKSKPGSTNNEASTSKPNNMGRKKVIHDTNITTPNPFDSLAFDREESKQDPSNKVGDPFVDVATDSEDEVFENYDDITNYINSKSSKAKSGTSRDFKVQTRKKK